MSFSYSYQPKVAMPWLSNDIPQMRSSAMQTPFYFGGSQVPYNLDLSPSEYNGSQSSGLPANRLVDAEVIDRKCNSKMRGVHVLPR